MDLYLTRTRRTPAPLGVAVVAVIGMIIWAFTAQGRAAAAGMDCPSETACKLDATQTQVIEDSDDELDDVDAKNGGGGSSGGSDSSGHGGGGRGGSDSGGDSSGDGKSAGSSHGGTSSGGGGSGSDSGGDSSGDGKSHGSSHGGTTNTDPPTDEPPTEEPPTNETSTQEPPTDDSPTNDSPGGDVLPGSGGPGGGMLPDTAVVVDGNASGGLIAGLLMLGAAAGASVRRLAKASRLTQ